MCGSCWRLSALEIIVSDAPTKSATVTFPTLELATAALAKVHGVALDAQPLVVVRLCCSVGCLLDDELCDSRGLHDTQSYAKDDASVVSERTAIAALGAASGHGDDEERETGDASARLPTLSREELDARRLDATGPFTSPSPASPHSLALTRCRPVAALVALADERFMKNYARGDVSATLYVKNLAKDVTTDELLAVFRAALPRDASLSYVSIHVKTIA